MTLICCTCEHELVPHKTGTDVLEHSAAKGPYKLYRADVWKCPTCNTKIAVPASNAYAEDWQPYFKDVLSKIHPENIVNNYEISIAI